jgi:hypothetical protein
MATGDVRELYYSYSESIDDGVRSIRVDYLAEGLTPTQAIEATGVPRYGDARVDQPTLLARNITASPRGSDSIVSVSFVPAQYIGGSVPPVNQFAEGFIGKDVSFDYDDIDLPLFKKAGLLTTDANGLPISKIVYADVDLSLPFRKRTPYYSVPIAFTLAETATLDDVFIATDAIVAQTDKIHTIFDRELLFACDGIDQQSETTYRAVYRWYEDKGIPNTLASKFDEVIGNNLGRIGTTIYPFFDESFVLPPNSGIKINGAVDPSDPPTVTFFDKYIREENGWATLPGIAT